MAKNTTQPRIAPFLKDLSIMCQKHGMIVDANGGGEGAGSDRGEARHLEGAPLVLYASTASEDSTYRKIGYLWYSFEGEEEQLVYNFEPKDNTPYLPVEPGPVTTPTPEIDFPY